MRSGEVQVFVYLLHQVLGAQSKCLNVIKSGSTLAAYLASRVAEPRGLSAL